MPFLWTPMAAHNDWLINCGNENAVNFTLKNFLRAQGVNSLPRLVLADGNMRNCGGAQTLDELFSIGELWTSAREIPFAGLPRCGCRNLKKADGHKDCATKF